MKKRESEQYCKQEAAAEIALSRLAGLERRYNDDLTADIRIGTESIGVVVLPSDSGTIELEWQHFDELNVDIIAFATCEAKTVHILGWLPASSIRELRKQTENGSSVLTINPDSLNTLEALRSKAEPHRKLHYPRNTIRPSFIGLTATEGGGLQVDVRQLAEGTVNPAIILPNKMCFTSDIICLCMPTGDGLRYVGWLDKKGFDSLVSSLPESEEVYIPAGRLCPMPARMGFVSADMISTLSLSSDRK